MNSRLLTCLTVLALLATAAAAQTSTSSDDDLVARFYPTLLGPYSDKIVYDFARADLDGTGRADYLVAVYGGNPRGVVRVLRAPAGGAASLAAEAAPDTMGGHAPTVRLADLDGDGRPEIAASFGTMGGAETWIFRWQGSALNLFGPTVTTGRRGLVHSIVGLADFFDVDGDGAAEIIDQGRVWKRSPDGSWHVAPNPILYVSRFERHTAGPELYTGIFGAAPGQKLTVTVVNGAGEHAVTAGDLYVNGQQIFGPADFKKKAGVLTATVTANAQNEVESMLEGKPGAAITVAITPAQ